METKKDTIDIIKKTIEDSVFCYANKAGQGFIQKSKCKCYLAGELSCEAYKETIEFYNLYRKLEKQGLSRKGILAEVKKYYQWDTTSWIQYNLKE
ncbi:hypothetical protein [Niallia sp. FSL R7-0271]|uniref:hypothetical protein n=1 Tax=Niallia sp. FSL R7-0271 TaxID=2921678 RepID=UPI0030FB1952